MSGDLRRPLRLLAFALALTAALVFVQTFVLRAAPYDAPYFGTLTNAFRAGFLVADVITIAALNRLGDRVPAIYAFTTTATVLCVMTVISGAFGFFTSAFGAIEPVLGFGATFLIVFALAAVLGSNPAPDRRRGVLMIIALVVTSIVLAMRLASAVSSDALNMALAWLRWAFAVAQPALVSAAAFVVARAKEVSDRSEGERAAAAAAAAGGGYRAAGEGVASAVITSGPRPDFPVSPEMAEPLRRVSKGISMHRAAYITRACAVGLVIMIAVGGAEIFGVLFPAIGSTTAILIAIGISRQRALATFGAGAPMLAALVCFVLASVAECVGFVWMIGELLHLHPGEGGAVAFPAATLLAGLGVLFASRAYERAGDLLYRQRLASLARWTQSLIVLVASSVLAVMFSNARGQGSDLGGGLAVVFFLLTLAGALAVVIVHIKTLNEASTVLRDRLAKVGT